MRRLIALGFALVLPAGCGGDDTDKTPEMQSGGASTTGGSGASGGTAGGTSSGGSTSGGTSMGGTSTGGTSSRAGSPATGGTATGGKAGAGGGRPGTAGASGRAGMSGGTNGGTSAGGTPSAPSGPVDTCYGDACPLGPCDNGGFFADEKCSDVYTEPVSEDSMFCAAGAAGGYCLNTITTTITYWAITCSGGAPSFSLCGGGCGVMGTVATCN